MSAQIFHKKIVKTVDSRKSAFYILQHVKYVLYVGAVDVDDDLLAGKAVVDTGLHHQQEHER